MKYILSANEIMEIISNVLKLPKENCEVHFHWILEEQIGVSSCEIEVSSCEIEVSSCEIEVKEK